MGRFVIWVVLFMISPIICSLLFAGMGELFRSSRISEYALIGWAMFWTVPIGGVVLIGMAISALFSPAKKSTEENSVDRQCPCCWKQTPAAYQECIWCHQTLPIKSSTPHA